MEFQTKARVVTVSEEVKTKSNNISQFVKCTVEHLDGPIKGKTFFANRTIKSIDQETGDPIDKPTVEVGQEVLCYNRVIDGNLYSEISIQSQVDNLEDILALVSASADATAQTQLDGQ